jgi:hypothetical protein
METEAKPERHTNLGFSYKNTVFRIANPLPHRNSPQGRSQLMTPDGALLTLTRFPYHLEVSVSGYRIVFDFELSNSWAR